MFARVMYIRQHGAMCTHCRVNDTTDCSRSVTSRSWTKGPEEEIKGGGET